jgi:hypothetical protein
MFSKENGIRYWIDLAIIKLLFIDTSLWWGYQSAKKITNIFHQSFELRTNGLHEFYPIYEFCLGLAFGRGKKLSFRKPYSCYCYGQIYKKISKGNKWTIYHYLHPSYPRIKVQVRLPPPLIKVIKICK